MTLKQLIAQLRSQAAAKLENRAKMTDELASIRAMDTVDAADDAKVEQLRSAKAALDAEIKAIDERVVGLEAELAADEAAQRLQSERTAGAPAPAYDRVARVGREERTYSAEKSRRGEASFFADAYGAQAGNQAARSRIERNLAEAMAEHEISERATSTSSFAGLVVPQYLVDQAALLARSGRPFANAIQHLPLPSQGMSLVIPRGTTGATEAVQATENSGVSSTDEVWSNLTVPVITIAGMQDVSRQSLERGTEGLDEIVYADLAGAYAVALNTQLHSGSGVSGQALGLLNTAGINQATAFGAAATVATAYSKIAGQINAVETTRFMAPTLVAMHPRRWNWFASQLDAQGRPFVVPNTNGPLNAIGVYDKPEDVPSSSPVGNILGVPVITDPTIPTAAGTGPEDQIEVVRREDLLLWEDGDGMPKQLRFEQTLGNQLTVKLVAYGYTAFSAGRYPTAVGVVGGNAGSAGFGLIAPTF